MKPLVIYEVYRVKGFSTSDGANISSELVRFDLADSRVGIGTNTPTKSFTC